MAREESIIGDFVTANLPAVSKLLDSISKSGSDNGTTNLASDLLTRLAADLLERIEAGDKAPQARNRCSDTTVVMRNLTPERRVEKKLRQTLNLMEAVFDSTSNGIVIKDLGGKYLLCNEAAGRMFGKSPAQVVGLYDADLIDAADLPKVREQDQIVVETGRLQTYEYELKNLDKLRSYVGTKSPYRDEAGNIVGVIGIVRDITRQKVTEREIRSNADRLRELADAIPQIVWTANADGSIISLNRRAVEYTGVSEDSLAGWNWTSVVHPEDRPNVLKEWVQIRKDRATTALKFRIRKHDGSYRWHICREMPIHDADGKVLRWYGTGTDIDDQITAEEALKCSESFLRSVIDNAGGLIWVKGLDGRYTLINRFLEPLFGHKPQDFLGKTVFDLFPPDQAETYERNNRLVLETGGPKTFEETVVINGHAKTFLAVKFPLRDAAGEITSLCGVCTDITERKELERALRESEIRLRTLIDHASDGFFLRRRGGEVLDVNQTACDMLGYSREELIGSNLQKFIIGRTEQDFQDVIKRLDAGETVSVLAQFRRKDDSRLFVDIRIRPYWVGGERFSVSLVRDITERLQAEEELLTQQKFIQRIADASPHVFYVFDVRRRKGVYINRQLAADLGFEGPDLEMFKGDQLFQLMHPDDVQNLQKQLVRWETASDDDVLESEYRLRDVRGKWHWFIGRDTVFTRSADGQVEQIIGTAQDVTDRRVLEEQLRQAQKMEAIGQFAGGIAHDFNNLLTVINGYCDLLLADPLGGARGRDWILAIRDAGQSATSLTNQLLAFGRRALVTPQPIDVNDLIAKLESLLRPLIGEDIRFHTILDPALPYINADRSQLEQVILNLAVNARDAMPQGGILTLHTSSLKVSPAQSEATPGLQPGEYVQISIADTGIGIEERILDRIFEPFFTTKDAGKGTGLGLAVVHGIITQSGGWIGVESRIGEGTRFRILLPAFRMGEVASPAAAWESVKGSGSILVIEDEDAVRGIVKQALESSGYRVFEASGKHDADRIVSQQGDLIDLIVTDVVMPGKNGREIVDEIRTQRSGIPVLFMSGYTDDEIVKRGVFASTDAFLQKPFTPATLTRKVHDLLSQARAAKQ